MPLSSDLSTTPISGHQVQARETTDRFMGKEAAQRTLEEVVNYKPLSERKNGNWKLASYNIFNAAGGFLGYVGSLCAHSQVMQSQKWYLTGLKDLGQTYLNAKYGTQPVDISRNRDDVETRHISKGEKFLRFMHNKFDMVTGAAWNTIPSLVGADLYGAATSSHREAMANAFSKHFQDQYGRPPSMELTANMSIEDLLDMAYSGDQKRMTAATKEAETIRANRPDPKDRLAQDITFREIRNGSPNLQAAFSAHMNKEIALENLHFMDWAEIATKGLDGALEDPQVLTDRHSTYQFNKFALMQAYKKGVRAGSDHEINIAFGLRNRWDAKYARHLQEFQNRWDRLDTSLTAARRTLPRLEKDSKEYNDKKEEIRTIESQMDAMRNEYLDPAASRGFGKLVQESYDAVYRLTTQSAQRFSPRLVDPEENEARKVFNRIAAQTNDAFARAVFTNVTGKSEPKPEQVLDSDTVAVMDEILKNNPQAQALTSQRTSAVLDGQYHAADMSKDFLEGMKTDANGYFEDVAKAANGNLPNISADMNADVGRATYTVNQETVSSPDHETHGSADAQRAMLETRLSNAGIPERDQGKLTAALNQQIFAGLPTLTMADHTKAPMPFVFAEVPPLNDRLAAGAEVSFKVENASENGVYNFVAIARKPLQSIQDLSGGRNHQGADDTDIGQSEYIVELAGQIDCNADHPKIDLTDGRVRYVALPKTGRDAADD